ncbi:hypothetical protein BT63DRAFT_475097 [Microthyrium microscopicum]|uniref:DUF202 domain-containing protein n=1 Tax=Microthyrium microscopicum TaxID=703497 RepID=A0A6A6UVI6_9PEZI|nr:hypothetical protein BT63DRAFT_475097 [Microthyrium microscopicum]
MSVHAPEPAHLRSRSSSRPAPRDSSTHPSNASAILASTDDRTALELPEIAPADSKDAPCLQPTSTSSTSRVPTGFWAKLWRQWERHVHLKVPAEQRRDHLALERTYLAYLRTSLALANTAVVAAQLLKLNSTSGEAGSMFGGESLAAGFVAGAIVVVLVGYLRFWRQQKAMSLGKVWAGGWELWIVGGSFVALTIAMIVIFILQPS